MEKQLSEKKQNEKKYYTDFTSISDMDYFISRRKNNKPLFSL